MFLLWSTSAPAQKSGVYHPVTKGVTLYRISLTYNISLAKLMEANSLSSAAGLKDGQRIFIPGAKSILRVEPYAPLTPKERKDLEQSLETEERIPPQSPSVEVKVEVKKERPPGGGTELDLIWPIQGKINSPFGPRGKNFHAGIDIASPSYQEVKAAMDGEVVLARDSNTGYGNVVVLRHGQTVTTIYGHMNVIIAKEGEVVRQGQAIGGVGSTGRSTGPHLHFELRYDRKPLDPMQYLPMTIEQLLEKAAGKKP